MDQPLDLRVIDQPRERAKGSQVGHPALNKLIDVAQPADHRPGVFQAFLPAQADALPLFVDIDDLDFDVLADAEHFFGVFDMLPGQFRNMHQPVDPAQVYEGPKVGEANDLPGLDHPNRKRVDDIGPALGH